MEQRTLCLAGASSSLGLIRRQAIETSSLGNWIPLRSRLAPIPFKGGRLFADEILQQADSLDKEQEQLKRACSFDGPFRGFFRSRLQAISQGYALPFLSPPPFSAGPVQTPLPVFLSQARSAVDRSPVPPGQGSHRGAYTGRGTSGILFSLLPSHQKDRRISPNPKSKRIECLSPHREIQDGDAGFHSSRPPESHVDDISGPERCISSCFHSASTQTVSEVCVERSAWISPHLTMESSAFWPNHGPRLITKLLPPVAAHLHLVTMSMYPYIDDIFHAQMSQELVSATRDASVRLHLRLGFIINLAKSSLVISQGMVHLGAWIETFQGVVNASHADAGPVQEISSAARDLKAVTQQHTCRVSWA